MCAGAVGLALWAGAPPPTAHLVFCALAVGAAASVALYVGGGCANAAALGVVPALWVLPLGWVPVTVALSLSLAALPGALAGRHPTWRVVTGIGDAAHVFAPVLVLLAAGGQPTPMLMIPALAAQLAFDGALSTAREWLGRGIRPRLQLQVMGAVYGVDALLMPVAVVLGTEAESEPAILLSLLPLCLLLGALARERNARLSDAADRVAALELERDRVDLAIHRSGMARGAALDELDALEIAVGTSVDALGAAAGRARLAGAFAATTFEALPPQAGAAEAKALLAAERGALAGRPEALAEAAGWYALAVPALGMGAAAICRRKPFAPSERRLFAHLVAQAGAELRSSGFAARERPDPLLGIAGREQLHAGLRLALERAERLELPVSVLMLDVDGLGTVNAMYGERAGDAVLRSVAGLVAGRCRPSDLAARYEQDRLVLVLPGADLAAARLVAEDLRSSVWRRPVPVDGDELRVTVSVGVAERTPATASAEAVLEAARRAMMAAKAEGRNRVRPSADGAGAHERR